MMTKSLPLSGSKTLSDLRRQAETSKIQQHGLAATMFSINVDTFLAILALIDRLETENAHSQQSALELEKLVYVPGLWKCAKCNFQLMKSYLNARDGSVTANNTPGDKCPNCDVPMWRVTERDAGNETVDRCEQAVIAQREIEIKCAKLEAENARLREALSDLADTAEGLNETHSPTVCDEIRAARVLTEMSHGEGEDADRQ